MDGTVEVETTREGDIAVAAFKSGCISDVEGIAAAGGEIKEFIEANQLKKLVFDFAEVKFFSSQVLGLLLDIRASLRECNGEVVISAINPQLHRVFKITNLDKIFRFFEDRQSAVKTMSTG
ncbi:MAG: STAS domain-containing protein [Phycisphaerae bacterium]|nr:STAS domain-containing protein [Phycisphaerae bacterium]